MPPVSIVSGVSFNVTAGFQRPADTTQYAAADTMGQSTTAAQMSLLKFTVGRINGGTFGLQTVRCRSIGGTSLTSASFTLHLWEGVVAIATGDNAAMTVPRVMLYLGNFSVTMDTIHADGLSGYVNVARIFQCGDNSKTIYGLQQSVSTYTPASAEKFFWTLEGITD